jgi:mannosyltransferase OCH1-like enzyme
VDHASFLQGILSNGRQTWGEIPKVVHHVYKENLEFGPWPNEIWKASYNSWKKYFPQPEYKHFFWGDNEMNAFFQKKCPDHWQAYSTETRDIVRSDLSRYCLLSKIGGIYADLDYEARHNFYEYLMPGMVNLVESPYQSESVQNSLMASPPGLPYWDKLMNVVDTRISSGSVEENILAAAGPALLDRLPETHDSLRVHVLPCNNFQRATHISNGEEESADRKGCSLLKAGSEDIDLMGIHWGTSVYNHVADEQDIENKFKAFRTVRDPM